MGRNSTGYPNGADHYGVKLNVQRVLKIRRHPEISLSDFAEEYKCHPDTIRQARNGDSWKHVEDGKCPTCGRSYE